MNTPTRLAAFALGLVVVLGGAAGIGHAVGPLDTGAKKTAGSAHGSNDMPGMPGMPGMSSGQPSAEAPAAGALAAFDHGYALQTRPANPTPGQQTDLGFTVRGPNGAPLTSYQEEHGKELHLILLRDDLTGYQHLHPTLAADGSWHVPVTFPAAGGYRMVADFTPAGATENVTLGTDLAVAGDYQPQPLPAPATSASVDGYTVTMDGQVTAGQSAKLTFEIADSHGLVTDLQPYLGAYGHLVAMRAGDLGYLHVHPDGEPGDGHTAAGPDVAFYVTVPTAGDYRLFLDFQRAGVVHTAAFTVHATASTEEGR
ncbi:MULTISPECIES: hypothetical protein [Kitasatospora]|uniref:hypothetical protein n=1 Tax=Kitasatospora TaxID=2063 RepID=UPI000CB6139C|nr:hypothetical protein [Kitasatospora sp. GP30]MDH6142447.1 hypothetical protein [Kitasatospora sp. GP30]